MWKPDKQLYCVSLTQQSSRKVLVAGTLLRVRQERWSGDSNDRCETCDKGGNVVLCDYCNIVYHAACVAPNVPAAVVADPDAPWTCPACMRDRAPHLDAAAHGLLQH